MRRCDSQSAQAHHPAQFQPAQNQPAALQRRAAALPAQTECDHHLPSCLHPRSECAQRRRGITFYPPNPLDPRSIFRLVLHALSSATSDKKVPGHFLPKRVKTARFRGCSYRNSHSPIPSFQSLFSGSPASNPRCRGTCPVLCYLCVTRIGKSTADRGY